MTTSSTLTVDTTAALATPRHRRRTTASCARSAVADAAPTRRMASRTQRAERCPSGRGAGDQAGDAAQAVIADASAFVPPPAGTRPAAAPGAGGREDADLPALRRVDHALLGLAVIVIASFLWMCAGSDDLSSPLRIALSWTWHAVAAAAIAAAVLTIWQLVRWSSWTVRLVAVGIVLLDWALKSLFG
jgi:hypothetical protein